MPRKDEPEATPAFDDLDKMLDSPEETGGEEQRLHPILSNEEVRAAQKKARDRLEAERRAKAMKRVEEEEIERLRVEEGLTTGDRVKDEIVDITIDLPLYADKIVVNGRAYHQGFTYPVARHVADSLREQMSRSWGHQDEIDGKNKVQIHQANRQFSLLAKGKAAPASTVMSATSGAVSGVKPANLGLRAGPEDHSHGG